MKCQELKAQEDQDFNMKKRDIIQLVKESVQEVRGRYGQHDYYGNNVGGRNSISGMPGVWESQGTLASDMLNYADQYHMELVDTMKGVSTHPDKRTGGFYIKFPHYNGPEYTGAMFGKDVSDKIEKSKAAAKAAAQKTVSKFQDSIEDYEISDHSRAGVYGNVWLWVMPKDMNEMHDFEKKHGDKISVDNFRDNPKLQPGKTIIYSGTRYKVLENTGYVLTLQSLESGKTLKVNLNQFISQGAIKENNMKNTKIKEIDTKTYAGVDAMAAIEKDPRFGTLKGDSKKDIKDKLKAGGAVELEEEGNTNASISKILIKLAVKVDNMGKHDEADMIKKLADQIQNFDPKAGITLNPTDMDEAIPDDEDEERGWMGADDAKDMMENYIKERGNDNLKEHINKYHKRTQLMESAWKDMGPKFSKGDTDEEIVQYYVTKGVAPEHVNKLPALVAKFRTHFNNLVKMKTDINLLNQEAEGLKQTSQPEVSGMEVDGMEEDKQLSSGLFNENKK